jgi:hypothetical protein
MVRTKYQRGSLKKIGSGQYLARWRRYSATPGGEKATARKKIILLCTRCFGLER